MAELTKTVSIPISTAIVQLKHVLGESVFMEDPEGNRIELKTTKDGTKLIFTKDENGTSLAIEERINGTKLYHISSDCTGLPSSHEIRPDNTEIVYFYNISGKLKHFVELKTNGDRMSTILREDGSVWTIEQKQIGGIIFQAWTKPKEGPKEGMIWLHPDGEITTYGNKIVISELKNKFARYLDGI